MTNPLQKLVLMTCVALAAPPMLAAQTLTIDGAGAQTLPAGDDFATEAIGDPWDFNNPEDYVYMFSEGFNGIPSLSGGQFVGTVSAADPNSPAIQLQFEGVNGALNVVGRNGVTYPIDASFYRRISFRMRRSPETGHALDTFNATWYSGTTRTDATTGFKMALTRAFDSQNNRYPNQSPPAVQANAQHHIYKLDLDLPGGSFHDATPPWANIVRGLRLTLGEGSLNPGGLSNATIQVDWVRLTPRGTHVATLAWAGYGGPVTLTATNGTDTIQIFPDDGTASTTFPANGSFAWDYGFLPPGVWTVRAASGGTSAQAVLTIETPPIIHLTEPDASGGRDFALTQIGDPWDMANPEDVTRFGTLHQVTNTSFGANGMTGTTTGNDPYVAWLEDYSRPPAARRYVNGSEYRHLTFTIDYDHEELKAFEALGPQWAGVGRIIWSKGNGFTVSQDIFVLDGEPTTYSMDLASFTTFGGDNDAFSHLEAGFGTDLWSGDIGVLRFDPYESIQPRSFRIANVKLAADDEPNGNGFFTIRWNATNATAGVHAAQDGATSVGNATVDLFYDTDQNPNNGGLTLIANDVPANAGQFLWNLGGLAPGRYFIRAVITDAAGNSQARYSTGPLRIASAIPPPTDNDGDGLADAWEAQFGVSSPGADPDGDGVSNLAEYRMATDPRISNTWNLSEGATGFFTERLAIVNPGTEPAEFDVTYLRESGAPIVRSHYLPGQQRLTIEVNAIPGLAQAAVSAVLTTFRGAIVVERTMLWDRGSGVLYGGHTGKAIQQAKTSWFLAEGEASFFDTYILFANANAGTANVTVTYLLEGGNTVVRNYNVSPTSRLTVHANSVPGVGGRAFSAAVASSIPITVERAMYFNKTPGRLWDGGHESAAVDAANTTWFVAEGRTGPFFDMYLLLANPGGIPANVQIRYLKPGGAVVTQNRTLDPTSRTTIHVDGIAGLEDTDVSASITSDQPIVVERAMYWPDPFPNWYEAHNSAGVTTTGTQWALAEGELGGALGWETWILVANPSGATAQVTFTFLRQGAPPIAFNQPVPANSRFTLSAGQVPGLASGERFGVLVTSTNGTPIVVEHAIYWGGGGEFWGGGTNETGVRIR